MSIDFCKALFNLIERCNEMEKQENGELLGILYTIDAVKRVFENNEKYRQNIFLSYDGQIVFTFEEDEYDEEIFQMLNDINRAALDEILGQMVVEGVAEVLVDTNGEILYYPNRKEGEDDVDVFKKMLTKCGNKKKK